MRRSQKAHARSVWYRLPVWLASLLLVQAVVYLSAPEASASHNPCLDNSWVNHHRGVEDAATGTYGARGTIRDRIPHLCSTEQGATSGASAWVMLYSASAPGWAQAGYDRRNTESTSLWIQAVRIFPTPPLDIWYPGFSAGSTHNYIVQYNFTSGRIQFFIDGSLKYTTTWTPEGVWGVGWQATWAAEAYDRGDDIPGALNAKTNFTNAGIKACRTCSYTNPRTPVQVTSQSYYKFEWVSNPTSFNVWTQR